jgi:hypothetical protein
MNENQIVNLLRDLEELEIKHQGRSTTNFFEAAGLGRQETRHSRFLSFLLDPSRPHGLSSKLFREIALANYHSIRCAEGSDIPSPATLMLDAASDLSVQCEWRNIDILCYSQNLGLVVAIENKIDAKETEKNGVSQLTRYFSTIESDPELAKMSKLCLYLTPEGEEPSDKNWCSINYQDILLCIETSLASAHNSGNTSSESEYLVNQYLDFLRRNIVSNPVLEADCRKIYQRHKDILIKIFEYAGVAGGISEYALGFAQSQDCKILAVRNDRFAYLPNYLDALIPIGTMDKPWWGQEKPLIFWFLLQERKLKLHFHVGPMIDISKRRDLIDQIRFVLNQKNNRALTDKYTVIESYSLTIKDDETDLGEKFDELHIKMNHLLLKIEPVISKFNFR